MIKSALSLIFMLAVGNLAAQNLTGTITADGKPMAGVIVTDGDKFVATDSIGQYAIKSAKKNGMVYITTPAGYVAESKRGFQPDFWAKLHPDKAVKEVHDFNLIPQQQDSFAIIFTADTHLTNDPVKHDFRHYKEIVLPRAVSIADSLTSLGLTIYSMNLGDLSHDLYWYQNDMQVEGVVEFITEEGFPALTYSVPGNHDNDPAIIGENVDRRSIMRYKTQLGPTFYSINIGDTHWIMLDDVIYKNIPGKGKQAKGVMGKRNYDGGLTKAQMKWIKNDLAMLPDSTKVFFCCHIPMIIDRKEQTLFKNPAQMDSLAEWTSRFGGATVFSGHAHRNLYQEQNRWPEWKQFVLTATSGLMWLTTNDFQTIGADGSASGLWVATFKKGEQPHVDYFTYQDGDPLFRAYDMNAVRDYYRTDSAVRNFLKVYPDRYDFSKKKYRNMVYVNFWGDRTGRRVEILEDGKPLEVEQVLWEDPLAFISYSIPEHQKNSSFRAKFRSKQNAHAYAAKTASPTSEITVNIYESDGTLLQSQTMTRPKKFDKDAK